MKRNTAAVLLAAAMAFSAGAGCLSFAADNIAETEMSETAETAESETETELVYEREIIMYLTDTVNVRALPDPDSEVVGYADRGEAIAVIGEVGDWYHVRLGEVELPAEEETEAEALSEADSEAAETEIADAEEEKTGYVRAKYLSENKSDADDAVAANEAEAARQAAAAAEAARQQAAAAAAGAAPSSGASGSNGGRTVVSQERVDDCDGSGHGVLIITYSDGTTETEEY